MKKIFLDIGNSYIKIASVINGHYSVRDEMTFDNLFSEGLNCLEIDGKYDVVCFSSVGKPAFVDKLKLLIQETWQVFPIQFTSQKQCCGLTSGYKDFSQLGDDRWFAMQGAMGIYEQPFIIVDAGTALTIDAVMNGVHQGGFIVPGMFTMRKSLSSNTQNLRLLDNTESHIESLNSSLLANNTQDAILGGCLYMTASFINHIVNDLSNQLQTQFKLILTGGDSHALFSLLDYDFDYIPDLVLQGLVNVEESLKNS